MFNYYYDYLSVERYWAVSFSWKTLWLQKSGYIFLIHFLDLSFLFTRAQNSQSNVTKDHVKKRKNVFMKKMLQLDGFVHNESQMKLKTPSKWFLQRKTSKFIGHKQRVICEKYRAKSEKLLLGTKKQDNNSQITVISMSP